MVSDEPKILRPAFGDPKVLLDRTAGPKLCQHTHVSVQARARRVICRMCREQVDPFEVLVTLCCDWEWATHWAQQLDERAARVESLKAEESALKQKIKRAYRAIPEPRSQSYFEEIIRRLNGATTWNDIRQVQVWIAAFPWLDSKQTEIVKDALSRAEQREKRHRKKNRRLKVVTGEESE